MDAMDMGNDNQRYSILDTNSYPSMYSISFSKHPNFNFSNSPDDQYDLAYWGQIPPSIEIWGDTVKILTVNTIPSSVPVPGAAWLFGTAMAGLVIRRKSVI
jgi:hypothetical protein